MACQAPIQQGLRKGETCGRETKEKYCSKHKRQAIIDKAQAENIRYCDIARGCFTVLQEHESKCTHCLHKARIQDRKRDNQKRQDATLCLDCGRVLTEEIRAKGKHDKLLRRCVPCYEKLLKQESERTKRERNFKAEAFTNKHVIWNHYVKGAKKRGIHFGLTKTQFEELIKKPCYYCTYQKQGEVNGVDRLDNQKGYIDHNVVPCCEPCNLMKGPQHPQEFIDKMHAIHMYHTTQQPIPKEMVEKWSTTYLPRCAPAFTIYSKGAISRNLEFTLTEEDFASIIQQPCYLCGLSNKSGIDRFQNSIGYRLENCRPCCGHCNLMKKDMDYKILMEKAASISQRYLTLVDHLHSIHIPTRSSKVEARVKEENPCTRDIVPLKYKPINEVIVPQEPIPMDIQQLLEKKTEELQVPKQWKTKQIYEFITTNRENFYKTHCEQENTLPKTWEEDWILFVLSVKGKSIEESTPIIKSFVENLRRIRHNALCAKDTVERDDRIIWPSHVVVRAFLDGKMEKFKAFTEAYTKEKPDEPKWMERWSSFISSLEQNREHEATLKDLCSTFMSAQRIKKYRAKK